MKFAPPPHTKKARIEIIPLIDVIFFLLATFVLVSLSMPRLQGIDMELPMGSAQKDPTQTPETVTVSIMASGNCVWDKRLMTQDQLMTRMAQYRRESPDPRILINGEEGARFGLAIEILDAARKMGIDKVSIKTKLQPVVIE